MCAHFHYMAYIFELPETMDPDSLDVRLMLLIFHADDTFTVAASFIFLSYI